MTATTTAQSYNLIKLLLKPCFWNLTHCVDITKFFDEIGRHGVETKIELKHLVDSVGRILKPTPVNPLA